MDKTFSSSDDVRSGRRLHHARRAKLAGALRLELGGELKDVTVAYETYGRLSEAKDNAVLVCHALSGDSHVAQHDAEDDPGWWDVVVGPGKAIDTNRFFVICPNILGGCRGTTGPGSTNPQTNKPYGADFPTITVWDMMEVQRGLVDHLGIDCLLAIVGGSLGGHQAIAWAIRYPHRMKSVVALATSPRLTTQALAFDVVGRNAILRDPNFHGGQYYDKATLPSVGLALARMIGHITYLSPTAMTSKFDSTRHQPRDVPTAFEKKFSVGSYLGYQGSRFVERFDANSYVSISLAMDLFDLGSTEAQLAAALQPARCRWLVISFSSDWLFPPQQSRDIVKALLANEARVTYCNVLSDGGHDAFLLEHELHVYGGMIAAFLQNLAAAGSAPEKVADRPHSPQSIFHHHRLDYDRIIELIPDVKTVLDLGCGAGGLLARLKAADGRRLVGVELEEQNILTCVSRDLDVVQADLNRNLDAFATGQFDCVLLSQTLQAVMNAEQVILEMLRIGKRGVVSIPNFAYRPLRRMLAAEGRAPKSAGVLHYEWYNTPNIRFFSLLDFEDFCRQKGITIVKRIALDTESGTEVSEDNDPNLNADLAIYVVGK